MIYLDKEPPSPWVELHRAFVPVVVGGQPIRQYHVARIELSAYDCAALSPQEEAAWKRAKLLRVPIHSLGYTIQDAGDGVCWVTVYGLSSGEVVLANAAQ